MWYDTIIIIKVDQKLSDLFHSQTFNEVKKSLWPSPLLKLKACFSRQVDVGPPQPVAAKVTVLYVAVHLNLRSVFFWVEGVASHRLLKATRRYKERKGVETKTWGYSPGDWTGEFLQGRPHTNQLL